MTLPIGQIPVAAVVVRLFQLVVVIQLILIATGPDHVLSRPEILIALL